MKNFNRVLEFFNMLGGEETKEPSLPQSQTEAFLMNLDHALKTNQGVIIYPVSKIDFPEFKALYNRLRSLGFNPNLTSNDQQQEFVKIDLKEYQGPRRIKTLI